MAFPYDSSHDAPVAGALFLLFWVVKVSSSIMFEGCARRLAPEDRGRDPEVAQSGACSSGPA